MDRKNMNGYGREFPGSVELPDAEQLHMAEKAARKLHKLLKKGKNSRKRKLLIFLLYAAFALTVYLLGIDYNNGTITVSPVTCGPREPAVVSGSDMLIHAIDVGEGDCTLVQAGGANILIDAGENGMGERVTDYLVEHGVFTLDVIVCTHPHSDHIGGMDTVINDRDILAKSVLMPDVPDDLVPPTRTLEDVLDAAEREGCELRFISADESMTFGKLEITIMTPFSRVSFTDLNDYSLCTRFRCGEVSFLSCGDLTEAGEKTLRECGGLKSTVYKASHHGSGHSNSRAFLEAVSPSYVYIPVGGYNDFGHPSKRVLGDLKDMGAAWYRTDVMGSFIIASDGRNVEVRAANS